jgi:ketopantoate reductase
VTGRVTVPIAGAPPRAFVIGWGEVGRRLGGGLAHVGVDVIPVTRSDGWTRAASDEDGLRVVCVREDDLPDALDRLAGVPAERVVTVQNGWVREIVPDGSTRGLIWFTSKGDFFRPLRPSPFCGPAAPTLATALEAVGIPAREVGADVFDVLDADKMGFNCVVGLPLAVWGVPLGEYLDTRPDEARTVFLEAVETCCRATGSRPPDDAWEAFVAAVEPLAWVATSRAKALDWRNGAVVRLAQAHGTDAATNRRLLQLAADRGV